MQLDPNVEVEKPFEDSFLCNNLACDGFSGQSAALTSRGPPSAS